MAAATDAGALASALLRQQGAGDIECHQESGAVLDLAPQPSPSTLDLPCLLDGSSRWLCVCRTEMTGNGAKVLGGCAVSTHPPRPLKLRASPPHADPLAPSQAPTATDGKRNRKRRRTTALNAGEKEMAERHACVRAHILADTEAVLLRVRQGRQPRSSDSAASVALSGATPLANRPTPEEEPACIPAGCVAAATVSAATPPVGRGLGVDFPAECPRASREAIAAPLIIVGTSDVDFHPTALINRLVRLDSPQSAQVINLHGVGPIAFPAGSQFICSDISVAAKALKALGTKFDLIVADPPWQNKSVARGGGSYACLSNDALEDLPISRLCKPGTLVAVWCTNKPKHLRFVEDELFRAWGVEQIGVLHWIKLNPDGTHIHSLDSPHKKPYEPLLIARCGGAAAGPKLVPAHGNFFSVPSQQHSRKPVVADLLRPLLCKGAGLGDELQCLELFGRNLLRGWTTWGNDVLRFQAVGGDGLCVKEQCDQCCDSGTIVSEC